MPLDRSRRFWEPSLPTTDNLRGGRYSQAVPPVRPRIGVLDSPGPSVGEAWFRVDPAQAFHLVFSGIPVRVRRAIIHLRGIVALIWLFGGLASDIPDLRI